MDIFYTPNTVSFSSNHLHIFRITFRFVSSNHCFISTNKSLEITPLFSADALCSSLNELSSQSAKSSFLLSSIIHMCFAISWNELFASAPFFLYAFALLLQAYLMKFLNGVSDLGINFSCCVCFWILKPYHYYYMDNNNIYSYSPIIKILLSAIILL